jgi:hypothetical protein
MTIKQINIGKLNITLVFRHRFEKPDEVIGKFRYNHEFREWELGLWFRKAKMVAKKEFRDPNKWKNYLVNSYMIGINLLLCKAWVDWNIGGMEIDINDETYTK